MSAGIGGETWRRTLLRRLYAMSGFPSFGKLTAVLCFALALVPAASEAASGSSIVRRSEGMPTTPAPAGYGLDALYEFKAPPDGVFPDGDLIAVNGFLYGTTTSGGAFSSGTVFEMSLSGKERALHAFKGGADGVEPFGSLVAVNGIFYGTTYHGGAQDEGTVYELSTSGVERVLYSFRGHADGGQPRAGLIYRNGLLYGTTTSGGASGDGTVFEVSTAGIERVLYSFKGGADGANPRAALLSLNGVLYGTTLLGGSSNLGTVFRIDPATGAERVIHSFIGASTGDGANPTANLIAVGGKLYGTTSRGGYVFLYGPGNGTIFEITTSGTETVLSAFGGGPDGAVPYTGLTYVNGQFYGTTSKNGQNGDGTVFVFDASGFEYPLYGFGGSQPTSGVLALNGSLYGTTASGTDEDSGPCGCSKVYKMSLSGVEADLHIFGGGSADGETPEASLIARNGLLYGTTASGGGDCNRVGCGTVFELSTSGQEHVLHSFIGGSDGGFPQAGLTAVNGMFFGTTVGSYTFGGSGCGTVFEVTPSGVERVLYQFKGGADGCIPNAPLIAVNGALYGTTYGSDGDRCYAFTTYCGTVFEVSTSGQERVLHSFTGGADGASPKSLTFMNGAFYGTTDEGGVTGSYAGDLGNGTVYELSLSGQERVLYRFEGGLDGGAPNGGLVAVNGRLYGTTSTGAINGYVSGGTVYELTTSGLERVLYRFQGGLDGATPQAGLIVVNGLLYGTTAYGGEVYCTFCGYGTIFSVTTSGKERVLYRFTGGADGAYPVAALLAVDGALYGTTTAGAYGYGTVFRLSPAPFRRPVLRTF